MTWRNEALRRSRRPVVGLDRIVALALLVVLALLVACHTGGRHDRHRPSAVPQEPYAELVARLDELPEQSANAARTTRYGTSPGGRPLIMITLGDASAATTTARPAVVLTQAVHGDEYLGIVDRLPAELLRAPTTYPRITELLARGGLIYFLPVVNPDGYEVVRRENDLGVDLNRDFVVRRYEGRLAQAERGELDYSAEQLSVLSAYVKSPPNPQPESRALGAALRGELTRANARLKLYVDYHCCQDEDRSALIHEWGDTTTLRDGSLPAADVARYERARALYTARFPRGVFGSGLETIGYMAFGSTDEWIYETFAADGVLAFTYEGQARREDQQLRAHAALLDALVGEPELR